MAEALEEIRSLPAQDSQISIGATQSKYRQSTIEDVECLIWISQGEGATTL